MSSLKDSTKTTVANHSIDLQIEQQNFKTLNPDDARIHLDRLAFMLTMIAKVMMKRLPDDGGNNLELQTFLRKLSDMLDTFVLKNRLEAMKPNSDIRLSCTIDPTDSGFPVIVRDFRFLMTDQEHAAEALRKLPEDQRLVDDALFLLFRGHFPKETVLQKLTRNYYKTLQDVTMPERLKIFPITHIKEEDRMHYCKKSFERLDDHYNLPRFYTTYLKVPSKTYPKTDWEPEIDNAISEGLSTVTALELGYLAKKIEVIEGVQLEFLERFDIGPFYSPHTENSETVQRLLESDDDCIMMFSKSMVVRTGEESRAGLSERLRGWRSGDTHLGEFSPAIESPQYILMPHRLIQKVHNLDIKLKEHTKMFGVTHVGEIYD
jgi:hypothetical protein